MPEHTAASVEAIAVTGACAVERRDYAMRLAKARGFILVPAEQTGQGVAAVDRMIELVRTAFGARGVVLEYPTETPVMEIVGALSAPSAGTELIDLVSVLDVGHLLDDLGSEEFLELGSGGIVAAKAELLVSQIEFASTAAIVNAQALSAEEFELVIALIGHLNPDAHAAVITEKNSVRGMVRWPFASRPPSAGWTAILNAEFWPRAYAAGLGACRYEQCRAFHPGRLHHVLTDCLSQGHCGRIIRSAGFARLASRPHVTAQWDQVGTIFTLSPLALDDRLGEGGELLAFGQDLAFFGLDLDEAKLREALDSAVLTDAELSAGPMTWARFADDFPAWDTARM